MFELSCWRCQDRAAEFALGVLEGRERCETLAHLQQCGRCQCSVAALSASAARLLELLPDADPSPDFADRVLAALPPPSNAPAQWQPETPRLRVPVAAALVATALLAVSGMYALSSSGSRAPEEPTRAENVQPAADLMAAPLISQRQQIGTAYISPGNPALVFVEISENNDTSHRTGDDEDPDATVTCVLVRRDGTTIPVGSFSLHHGNAAWAVRASVDPHSLTGATLTTQHGHTLGSANFRTPDKEPADAPKAAGHSEDQDSKPGRSQPKSSRSEDSRPEDSRAEDSRPEDSRSAGPPRARTGHSHTNDGHHRDRHPGHRTHDPSHTDALHGLAVHTATPQGHG